MAIPTTTKVRQLLCRLGHPAILTLLSGLLLSSPTQASKFDDPPPSYSISPSTNGLNVSYFAQQDKVKVTLYMVNHERFPITCQAAYDSGPEKKRSREQTFQPEKAVAFPFDYGRHSGGIVLSFVCEKARAESANP